MLMQRRDPGRRVCRWSNFQSVFSNRPLPLGEGWGERLASTATHFFFSFCLYASRPHPRPLPKGEGTKSPRLGVLLTDIILPLCSNSTVIKRCALSGSWLGLPSL